jgi:hypothetical protein
MRKHLTSGLMAAHLLLGGIVPNETVHAASAETETAHYTYWVYQVTSVEEGEYYGQNTEYQDFPNVYFTQAELAPWQNIREGDWVVTVFVHDDISSVIKIN